MKLMEQLIRHEGLKLKPYTDSVGKLTIGVGRNLEDVGISESEAMSMLENDINRAQFECVQKIDVFHVQVKARQDVLINMVFNMGVNRVLGFKNMLRAIRNGDYAKAASDMLDSKWARQVGNRARELANQMKSGAYQ